MSIKIYEFEYEDAAVTFRVDLNVFSPEMASATLDFFSWDDPIDDEADPVDEVMKKYAMRAIKFAGFYDMSEFNIIKEFDNMEGFAKIDGSSGILLTYFSGLEFTMADLDVKIVPHSEG